MEKGSVESRMQGNLHVRFGGSPLIISTFKEWETWLATQLLPPSLLLFVFASVIENGAGILTVLE